MIWQFRSPFSADVSAVSESFLHPHPAVYGVYILLCSSWPQRSAVLQQFTAPHAHCSRPRPTANVPIRKKTYSYLLSSNQTKLKPTFRFVLLHYLIIIVMIFQFVSKILHFLTETTSVWWRALSIRRPEAEHTTCSHCQLSDLATHAGVHAYLLSRRLLKLFYCMRVCFNSICLL